MKIAVVGSYGVGMTMHVPQVPARGETVAGGSYSSGPGGKGSNQAVAAARLGAEVSLLTAVGDDPIGREARRMWADEGVTVDHLVISERATMVGFILVESDGENRIVIAPGALDDLRPQHVEAFRGHIRSADLLLVSMEIPLPVVAAALRVARQEGVRTLLNPAPAQPLPDELWPMVDVITPNRTEAPVVLGLAADHGLSDDELVGRLQQRTQGIAVLTLGSGGCLTHDGTSSIAVAAVRAPVVVDTTGAGDAFTAALAVALVEGRPLPDAVRFAAAAGAHAVGVAGVIDALPRRIQLNDLMGTRS